MSWDDGRAQHLELSEAAAAHYDEIYAYSNFATGSYMDYEVKTLERWAPEAPDQNLAIDLGCGTGRDSFVLARRFDQVYAYDFSPAMIEVAIQNKLKKNAGNVLFQVRDIEQGLLDIEPGTASFVNSAFGMGSFIENVESFFREVKRILKPRGIAVFSFYNSHALVNQLDLQWKPALAARAESEQEILRVEFENQRYEIAARAYKLSDIERQLKSNFEVLDITTFPTLSALFPQELFENESARQLCTNVDELLASNRAIAAGPYIVGVVRRSGRKAREQRAVGYERVLSLLSRHNVHSAFKVHAPVRTMAEVQEILDVSPSNMLKSIVVAVTDDPTRDERHPRLYLFGIPADRKLDFGKVASYLRVSRRHVRAASQSEVEDLTGFTVGSIPPFGMPSYVATIIDVRLSNRLQIWCGTGRPTESLELSLEDLRKLSAYSVADISKPL
jgi:prolyl-tRNA editing enzyme YbaK/EbsC (Cys-tRNA(Pro) deacylase)/SAM-dependent methyltransferase